MKLEWVDTKTADYSCWYQSGSFGRLWSVRRYRVDIPKAGILKNRNYVWYVKAMEEIPLPMNWEIA